MEFVGTVIDVASSSIAVRDGNNDEASVVVSSDTVIRYLGETIGEDGVVVGEGVTVIGQPNESGQIEARFIRGFPPSLRCLFRRAFLRRIRQIYKHFFPKHHGQENAFLYSDP